MKNIVHFDPITESDDVIKAALEDASIPTLALSVVHMTGDTSIIDGAEKPLGIFLNEVQGFMSDEDKAAIRAKAFDAIKAYRDRGCTLPSPPDEETIYKMMCWATAEEVSREHLPLMLEELALDGADSRETTTSNLDSHAAANFPVLIIGAGMSGVLAGLRLAEAGIPYTILEKNSGIGGTWWSNAYPGARVDVGNHFYCYSFEESHHWSQFFSKQPELQKYFEDVAAKHDVTPHIHFDTEVLGGEYDEAKGRWTLTTRSVNGEEHQHTGRAVISAVGQMTRPKLPDVKGIDTFQGPSFHSAEWQHEHSYKGKRVAVVGTGASAYQIVPTIAADTEQTLVIQRSPPWMFENPDYHKTVSDGAKWLFKHLPYYARWYRFLLMYPSSDNAYDILFQDPDWDGKGLSINEANEFARIMFTEYMDSQIGDDQALRKKIVPDYPPMVKRTLQDNGSWIGALKRDNVELIDQALAEVTPNSIITADGTEHNVDMIVYATGFYTDRFLWPIELKGKNGMTLKQKWGNYGKALYGITVPDFPNLFCMYGPGLNVGHGGSLIFSSECQIRYIMDAITHMVANNIRELECKEESYKEYGDMTEEKQQRTVWAWQGTNNNYKNEDGLVTTVIPHKLVEYWRWTRTVDLDDYHART